MARATLCVLVFFLFAACRDFSPEWRRENAAQMAAAAGWQPVRLSAGGLVLMAFVPQNVQPADLLTVYVEGDGLAWISRSQISSDPTPMHPLALQLALRQPVGNAAYLARPCQYLVDSDMVHCDSGWWSGGRFSLPVVEATGLAIDQLKKRFGASRLVLVGYSGGGAVAALVAARRHDVVYLGSVAGNLDTVEWARLNRVSPMTDSLNPADEWAALRDVPQMHFSGGKDDNVSTAVARAYQARFPANRQPAVRVIEGFDHACCWVERWPELYRLLVPAAQ